MMNRDMSAAPEGYAVLKGVEVTFCLICRAGHGPNSGRNVVGEDRDQRRIESPRSMHQPAVEVPAEDELAPSPFTPLAAEAPSIDHPSCLARSTNLCRRDWRVSCPGLTVAA